MCGCVCVWVVGGGQQIYSLANGYPKGSMLIFLEATLHTTLPWFNRDRPRRSLLYRYSPPFLHYGGGSYITEQPAWVRELTVEQQAVLEPAFMIQRPELDNDGKLIRPERGELLEEDRRGIENGFGTLKDEGEGGSFNGSASFERANKAD